MPRDQIDPWARQRKQSVKPVLETMSRRQGRRFEQGSGEAPPAVEPTLAEDLDDVVVTRPMTSKQALRHADTNVDPIIDAKTNGEADTEAGPDAHTDLDTDLDTLADGVADGESEPDVEPDADGDGESVAVEGHILVRQKKIDTRLDAHLASHFPRFSRRGIQQLIDAGLITVNGKPTKNSYKLKAGDRVDLTLPAPVVKEIVPEPIPLHVLYEDDAIVVLDKQANLITHPGRGNTRGTLINGLVHHFGQNLSNAHEDPLRPGIVHRLDRDTSGVILVAKDDQAHIAISADFEFRRVGKEYLAIVDGIMELDNDFIDLPIGKHSKVREKMAVRHDGKEAQTMVHVMARYTVANEHRRRDATLPVGFTVVRLVPRTGRTHQLRVHLSHMGYPIVADHAYGGRTISPLRLLGSGDDSPLIARQALHAWHLEVTHPLDQRRLRFEAPLHPDMWAHWQLIAAASVEQTDPTAALLKHGAQHQPWRCVNAGAD